MNKLLSLIYGRDTRAVQNINLVTNFTWFVLLILNMCNSSTVDVPIRLNEDSYYPLVIVSLSVVFGILGSIFIGYKHQLFKLAGLLFGSLVQAIIASAYISKYPPFEPMLIVCVLLSLWFLGAVIYISNLEGLDECTRD